MNNGVDQIPVMDLMENVRLLNKARKELYSLLERNGIAIVNNLTAIYEHKIGVKVGSIVESGGEEYRVTDVVVRVEHEPNGKPWVHGNPRRNCDGEFGTVVKNLFSDWELVTK